MTDERLRALLEERVADLPPVDLASSAWGRAAGVRRRRRTVAGVVVAVLAVVGGATVVATGRGEEPPPPPATIPTPSVDGDVAGTRAKRGSPYEGAETWWAPTTAGEAALPRWEGPGLPEEIDFAHDVGPVPPGVEVMAVLQVWGQRPGTVLVVTHDGSYGMDLSRLQPFRDAGGNLMPPLSQDSVSPDGRYVFFRQPDSLSVYEFATGRWTSVPAPDGSGELAAWAEGGGTIRVPEMAGFEAQWQIYTPDGTHLGTSMEAEGVRAGPTERDERYGTVRADPNHAGSFSLAEPVMSPDGVPFKSVDAVVVGEPGAQTVLAMPPGARWVQCCPSIGWLEPGTLLFESRHEEARILAWRPSTGELWRVSDIRGWTPGEESYVASFADLDMAAPQP